MALKKPILNRVNRPYMLMQSYNHLLYCPVTSFRLLEIEVRELEAIEAYNIEILEAYDIRQKKFLKGIFVKKIF